MKICEREGSLGIAFVWSFAALGLSSFTRLGANGLKVFFFFSSVLIGLMLLSKSVGKARWKLGARIERDNRNEIKSLLWPWVGLFIFYVVSGFWSVGPITTYLVNLYEYRVLLAVPFFTWCLLHVSANEKYLQVVFSLGAVFGCALLYSEVLLNRFGLEMGLFAPRGSYIIGGMISSVGVVLILHLSLRLHGFNRWFWVVCAVCLSIFVLSIDTGRTGYLQIISVWTLWVVFNEGRSRLPTAIIFICVLPVLVFISDSTVSRILLVLSEIDLFSGGDVVSSSGFRLEAWRFSLSQFWNAPIFGHGIGSYQNLLSESYANGSFRWKTDNLHTEIGNTLVNGGGIALILLFAIIILPGRLVSKVETGSDLKFLMSGLLSVFFISALFNSSFKDFGEKHVIMVLFPYLFISMLRPIKLVSAVEN